MADSPMLNTAELAAQLTDLGRALPYPPTPDLRASVMRRLSPRPVRRPPFGPPFTRFPSVAARLALALLLLVLTTLLVPHTREAVARFIGLRTVRVTHDELPPSATPPPATQTPVGGPSGSPTQPTSPNATPLPADTLGAGLTSLEAARAGAPFVILLPAFPSDLGAPSEVYLQNFGFASQVILAYADRFTLFEAEHILYQKIATGGVIVREVDVNGEPALWLENGEHLVLLSAAGGPDFLSQRAVGRNTLAWEKGDVTFRLETDLPLDEAIQIAESIK